MPDASEKPEPDLRTQTRKNKRNAIRLFPEAIQQRLIDTLCMEPPDEVKTMFRSHEQRVIAALEQHDIRVAGPFELDATITLLSAHPMVRKAIEAEIVAAQNLGQIDTMAAMLQAQHAALSELLGANLEMSTELAMYAATEIAEGNKVHEIIAMLEVNDG